MRWLAPLALLACFGCGGDPAPPVTVGRTKPTGPVCWPADPARAAAEGLPTDCPPWGTLVADSATP